METTNRAELRYSVDNILDVWDQSDFTDFSEGMLAYTRYRMTMESVARKYRLPVESVTGAFVALSPNNDYINNLRSVVSLLEGGQTTSTYDACRRRAQRCLRGEHFLSFTEGPKTRSFFLNIVDPYDPYTVTIDGHALSVSCGRYMRMKEAAYLKFDYEYISHLYRQAAKAIHVLPNQLQAVTWFTWKRINRAVYDPQMNLFIQGNQWQAFLPADDIKGFSKQHEIFS